MLVIPALDLHGGQCVRLRNARYEKESAYFADPVAMAKLWRVMNAKVLHLIDLDAAGAIGPMVPGNDRQHSRALGQEVSRLIPNAELHELMGEDLDVDLGPIEDWNAIYGEMADTFTEFLSRNLPPAAGK